MYRCIVTQMLVLCLLLTQFATVARCHGGSTTGGQHHSRPHVHLKAFVPKHGPCGHHHQQSQTITLDGVLPQLPDHDSDAIYFSTVDVSAVERTKLQDRFDSERNGPWLSPVVLDYCWIGLDLASVSNSPEPRTSSDCPLYVRLRALLI